MDKPKVSICIPAYNNVAEVKRLLESIRMQTFRDWEIILTDDSSNEEITELVKNSDWGPLRYIHNEKPLGHIFNWNKSLSEAQGEYIKIMFSDDWFTAPDSLEKMVSLLERNPEASLAFCGTMQVMLPEGGQVGSCEANKQDLRIKQGLQKETEDGVGHMEGKAYARAAEAWYTDRLAADYRNLFLGNEIGAPSATIYRTCGAMFDEKSNWASDMFLYFEILGKNPRFACTKEPLISIGIHEAQYTGMFEEKDLRKFNDTLYMYEKYKLRESPGCREYMLRQILKFRQGWKTAGRCGISRGEYTKQGIRWFWENTVLGYWNGAMHKLRVRKKEG